MKMNTIQGKQNMETTQQQRGANCIEGFRCPECGNFERFKIVATSAFTMEADGSEEYEGVEWDNDSHCTCPNCCFGGLVRDFLPGAAESFEERLAALRAEWERTVGESDENRTFVCWLAAEYPAIVPVAYVSEWEEGIVETSAMLDLQTGEVAGIEVSDDGGEYESLIREYIADGDWRIKAEVELLPDDTTRVTGKDDLEALRNHFHFKPNC